MREKTSPMAHNFDIYLNHQIKFATCKYYPIKLIYQQQRHVPDLTRKPSASALKKSPSSSSEGGGGSGVGQLQGGGAAARKKKAPAFNDRYTQ